MSIKVEGVPVCEHIRFIRNDPISIVFRFHTPKADLKDARPASGYLLSAAVGPQIIIRQVVRRSSP
jgi:hypothetical protein